MDTNHHNSRYKGKNWNHEISHLIVLWTFISWDSKVWRFKTSNHLLEIFNYFSFWWTFSSHTPTDIWIISDLWVFDEWANKQIPWGTNTIFKKHFKAILFTPKHIKIWILSDVENKQNCSDYIVLNWLLPFLQRTDFVQCTHKISSWNIFLLKVNTHYIADSDFLYHWLHCISVQTKFLQMNVWIFSHTVVWGKNR